MTSIIGYNIPEAYLEVIWALKTYGVVEDSRNGKVISIPHPVELRVKNPRQRVLWDIDRDANPFFHVMEFVWMMAGSKSLEWIEKFNSGLAKYSDDKLTLPAGYGYRWREHFCMDQILKLKNHLKSDPTSRRAVLTMWDPLQDLAENPTAGLDRPCNTHAYFRVYHGKLNMTVLNRSNDAIWGMLGANAVHMTMLQELLAQSLELGVGEYRVYTNNLHIYMGMPNYDRIMSTTTINDRYNRCTPMRLLHVGETIEQFLEDAEAFVMYNYTLGYQTHWFRSVAEHMRDAYLDRKRRMEIIHSIAAEDWKDACLYWAVRKAK